MEHTCVKRPSTGREEVSSSACTDERLIRPGLMCGLIDHTCWSEIVGRLPFARGGIFILLTRGEAALPFEFQFDLHACQLSAKLLNLVSKFGAANSRGVQSLVQTLRCRTRMIRLNRQRPQRNTAEMRTSVRRLISLEQRQQRLAVKW
jgi:hypothetical protein